LTLNKIGSRFRSLWLAFVESTTSFLDEAGFRISLAWSVLRGRMPEPVAHRFWNRAVEVPTLLHVKDWTNDRTAITCIVWPAMEIPDGADPFIVQQERVSDLMHVIAKGAADKLWHIRFEADYGLRWVPERQAWISTNGHLYHSSLGSIQHKKLRTVRQSKRSEARGEGVAS
jgi:hypothetical protein